MWVVFSFSKDQSSSTKVDSDREYAFQVDAVVSGPGAFKSVSLKMPSEAVFLNIDSIRLKNGVILIQSDRFVLIGSVMQSSWEVQESFVLNDVRLCTEEAMFEVLSNWA